LWLEKQSKEVNEVNDNTKIFNTTKYKQRRQQLRHSMTEPEKRLWKMLRHNQMGVKFRRQHGIGHLF
jgi:very-short-patch-repair endonuclease